MQITVIGSGAVGRALIGRLAESHRVTLGARDPMSDSARAAVAELGEGFAVAPVAKALAAAEVVVTAIPGAQVPAFAAEHGGALAGRLVIDASNDLSGGPGSPLHHVGEWQAAAPGAVLARAFCSMGWETIAEPAFSGEPATLFWCGPDGDRAAQVEAIGRDVGLAPVRIGDLAAADTLDGVARLWFQLAFAAGFGRRIGFRLLAAP